MKTALCFLTVLFISLGHASNEAKLVAVGSHGQKAEIAQDSKGTPRVNQNSKSYPSIKVFSKGGDYVSGCYVGGPTAVRELLTALTRAADGDSDTYAELKSLRLSGTLFTVSVLFTGESGEKVETFSFDRCL